MKNREGERKRDIAGAGSAKSERGYSAIIKATHFVPLLLHKSLTQRWKLGKRKATTPTQHINDIIHVHTPTPNSKYMENQITYKYININKLIN